MRRGAKQDLPLTQVLADQAEFPLREIAEPAMDEACRAGRRAFGEVVLLDECHGETSKRGVACGARAHRTPADDEHVEDARVQGPQVSHAVTLSRPILARGKEGSTDVRILASNIPQGGGRD